MSSPRSSAPWAGFANPGWWADRGVALAGRRHYCRRNNNRRYDMEFRQSLEYDEARCYAGTFGLRAVHHAEAVAEFMNPGPLHTE